MFYENVDGSGRLASPAPLIFNIMTNPTDTSDHILPPRHLYPMQRTVARPVVCSGRGVHSGQPVTLTIQPAPVNHGIKFSRVDLLDHPVIPALFHNVVDTSLATVLGEGDFIISTVEHLMATLFGMGIDNALVEVDAHELPIMDGSARPFAELIRLAGIENQAGPRCYFRITEPIEHIDGDRSVALYPHSTFRITCRIEYDHPLIKTQELTLNVDNGVFENEISYARTFGFLSEYDQLKRYGLSQGCSLDNVVVIDGDHILNRDGLRVYDEFVRHKLLDCLGDFSLLGMPIIGHLVAKKAGHAMNHAFIEKFLQSKQAWETHTIAAAPASARP